MGNLVQLVFSRMLYQADEDDKRNPDTCFISHNSTLTYRESSLIIINKVVWHSSDIKSSSIAHNTVLYDEFKIIILKLVPPTF